MEKALFFELLVDAEKRKVISESTEKICVMPSDDLQLYLREKILLINTIDNPFFLSLNSFRHLFFTTSHDSYFLPLFLAPA